jgi:hypothetical protein
VQGPTGPAAATNGLTLSAGPVVSLGGSLTQNTTINTTASFALELLNGAGQGVRISGNSAAAAPTSITGAVALPITTVSANTTLDATHYTVIVDTSAGARTVTLPTAANARGRVYVVKRVGGNDVTISRSGTDQIELRTSGGLGTTTNIATNYCSIIYQSDGVSTWYIQASKCY